MHDLYSQLLISDSFSFQLSFYSIVHLLNISASATFRKLSLYTMTTHLEAFFKYYFTPARSLVETDGERSSVLFLFQSNETENGIPSLFHGNETENGSDLFVDLTYNDPHDIIFDNQHNIYEASPYGDHQSEFGVHITYDKLYNSILFLACIYVITNR